MSDAPERIAKVLSRAGVASRREAERMIAEGRVSVNGRVLDSPAVTVTSEDRISVDGKPLAAPDRPRLWLYHKPEGLVTSAADEKGRDTVFDHLPEGMPRVMPVGRLDLNSEGLLLLTNDGELKRRLELPATGWLRKYRVRVKGNPTEADLAPLKTGITVDGEHFQPMTVTLDRTQGANAWLTVGLREGRNREIRRAMTAIGLTVNRLIRTGYGPFRLGDLAPGAVEEIKAKVLRDQLGLEVSGGPVDLPEPQREARRPLAGAASTRPPRAGAEPAAAPLPPRGPGPGPKVRPPRPETTRGTGAPKPARPATETARPPRKPRTPAAGVAGPAGASAPRPPPAPAGRTRGRGEPRNPAPQGRGGKPRKGR